MYPSNGDVGQKSNYPWTPRKSGISSFGDPSTFSAAANQQGSDYDAIMKQYQDFINNSSGNLYNRNLLNYSPITGGKSLTTHPISSNNSLDPGNPITSNSISSGSPLSSGDPIRSAAIRSPENVKFDPLHAELSPYEQSSDVTSSLARLKDLTDTGGYTQQGIQDIRERNLSPIRSIYASGKQGLERQRSLSGGYSPNFNAVSASMARDEASKIGDITTRTNADIAQNVASNRLAAASPYASASASANAAKTAADQKNADIINQINEYNANQKGNIDEFNTSTNIGVDKYNRDTQLGIDRDNRDTRMGTDRYNRDTQIGVDKYNSDKQLGIDIGNRDTRLNTDRYNRDMQLGIDRENRDSQLNVDKSNRDFQFGVDSSNRDAKLGVDKFNIDDLVRRTGMDKNDILEAIRGKTSLYGTNPALASLFGSQVLQTGQLGQNQQDINNRRRAAILSAGR